jgi:hypothetical protein
MSQSGKLPLAPTSIPAAMPLLRRLHVAAQPTDRAYWPALYAVSSWLPRRNPPISRPQKRSLTPQDEHCVIAAPLVSSNTGIADWYEHMPAIAFVRSALGRQETTACPPKTPRRSSEIRPPDIFVDRFEIKGGIRADRTADSDIDSSSESPSPRPRRRQRLSHPLPRVPQG